MRSNSIKWSVTVYFGLLALVPFMSSVARAADSTVTNLPAASTLDGSELLLGVQGGASKKVTGAQIKAYTGAGFNGPVGSVYTGPNGVYVFVGPDGTTQFMTGATASAAEFVQSVGGIASGGATLLCRNAAQTGNVNCNMTAQGNGNIFYGNNGHGTLGVLFDPGNTVSNPVQMTPSTSSIVPVKIGNATGGINLDCGSNNNCQVAGQPIGIHDLQFYSGAATTTWTKPANANFVRAYGCGGGGSGGSGALVASGTAASGGGGGGGGGCFDQIFRASDLASSVTVKIGAGGASVAGQTTSSTAGINGNAGNYTCFNGSSPVTAGMVACGGGGGGGAGGQISATSGGGAGATVNGSAASATGASGASATYGLVGAGGTGSGGTSVVQPFGGGGGGGSTATGGGSSGGGAIDACGGGGSGGGVTTAPASNNGGAGGAAFRAYKQAATSAGGTSGTPNGGSTVPAGVPLPGNGGGGGYGNSAGASGVGGAGTQCGGGGGGGSALNGSAAGASGAGADGWMIVHAW